MLFALVDNAIPTADPGDLFDLSQLSCLRRLRWEAETCCFGLRPGILEDYLGVWHFYAKIVNQLAPQPSGSCAPLESVEISVGDIGISLNCMVDICSYSFRRIDDSMARIPTLKYFLLKPSNRGNLYDEKEQAIFRGELPKLRGKGQLVFHDGQR